MKNNNEKSAPVNKPVNDNNQRHLESQLQRFGFGAELQTQVHAAMLKGEPAFTLKYQPGFDNHTQVALHFSQAQREKPYLLDHYVMQTKNSTFPYMEQRQFKIGLEQDPFTVKEAFNLMNGRAVYKDIAREDGSSYTAWVQLNFRETDAKGQYALKQFMVPGGSEIEQRLTTLNVKEMSTLSERNQVILSLMEGNRVAVTLGNTRAYVEAAPQFKSVNFYDEHQQRIRPDQVKAIANGEQVANTNDVAKSDMSKQQARGQGI